jgi:hypothetical protein
MSDHQRWSLRITREDERIEKVLRLVSEDLPNQVCQIIDYGWGESGLSGRELAVAGAVQHFREFLIGKNPLNVSALRQEMYRSRYFEGGRVLTAAISAIDIALYDLAGRALGVPVYQLLGGKHRDYVPGFATTQAPTLDQMIADVKLLLEHGWNVIRANPGFVQQNAEPGIYEPMESVPLTARWLTKIREEVGMGFVLGTDYHHRLSVDEAASFCQRMPAGTLDFLEEPIRAGSEECVGTTPPLRRYRQLPVVLRAAENFIWHVLEAEPLVRVWPLPGAGSAADDALIHQRRAARTFSDGGRVLFAAPDLTGRVKPGNRFTADETVFSDHFTGRVSVHGRLSYVIQMPSGF